MVAGPTYDSKSLRGASWWTWMVGRARSTSTTPRKRRLESARMATWKGSLGRGPRRARSRPRPRPEVPEPTTKVAVRFSRSRVALPISAASYWMVTVSPGPAAPGATPKQPESRRAAKATQRRVVGFMLGPHGALEEALEPTEGVLQDRHVWQDDEA